MKLIAEFTNNINSCNLSVHDKKRFCQSAYNRKIDYLFNGFITVE